jgi:hypothetical protein
VNWQEEQLRERKRLLKRFGAQPMGFGMTEDDMKSSRMYDSSLKKKGLGFATGGGKNKRPASRTLEYVPERDGPPVPREKPPQRYDQGTFQPMGWDDEPMDSIGDAAVPPRPYPTMEYKPERDGPPVPPYTDDPYAEDQDGYEDYGKQEYNQKPRYSNRRSEIGDPVPEDRAYIFNTLFDELQRSKPPTDEKSGINPTELDQWQRWARKRAAEEGLTPEETEDLIMDVLGIG